MPQLFQLDPRKVKPQGKDAIRDYPTPPPSAEPAVDDRVARAKMLMDILVPKSEPTPDPRLAQAADIEAKANAPAPKPQGLGQTLGYSAIQGLRGMGTQGGYPALKVQDEALAAKKRDVQLEQAKTLRASAQQDFSNTQNVERAQIEKAKLVQDELAAQDTEKYRQAQLEQNKYTPLSPGAGVLNTKTGQVPVQPTVTPKQYSSVEERELDTVFNPLIAKKYGTTVDRLSPEQLAEARSMRVNQGDIGRKVAIRTKNEKGEEVTKFVNPEGEYAAPDTTDMKNKAVARQNVGRGLNAMQELGKKVITEKMALQQKAKAAGRKFESMFGDDPEFLTYQSARKALAANLAVAQQGGRPSDTDVMAIWVPMIPDVFTDTVASQKMKWDFIRILSNQPDAKIRVKNRATGKTGMVSAQFFDPVKFEKVP